MKNSKKDQNITTKWEDKEKVLFTKAYIYIYIYIVLPPINQNLNIKEEGKNEK